MRLGTIFVSIVAALALGACDNGNDNTDAGSNGNDSGTSEDTDAGSHWTDGGSDDTDGGTTPATFRDVTINITGADPHIGNLVELRIVDGSDNLVARGVVEALPSGTYSFSFPHSTPEGAHRLDFFADLSGNGTYDSPPADHAWREDIADTGDVSIDWAHNIDFTDISSPALHEGSDLTFNASGVTPHIGNLFELRFIRTDDQQLVGRYVIPAIDGDTFTIVLEGILQDGVEYNVDYYADLSMNGEYDPPGTDGDHAWRDTVTATADGATVDFVHNTDFTDVGF
jgi:hypothetical protein